MGVLYGIGVVTAEFNEPTLNEVHIFIRDLFVKAQLSAECSIGALNIFIYKYIIHTSNTLNTYIYSYILTLHTFYIFMHCIHTYTRVHIYIHT